MFVTAIVICVDGIGIGCCQNGAWRQKCGMIKLDICFNTANAAPGVEVTEVFIWNVTVDLVSVCFVCGAKRQMQ